MIMCHRVYARMQVKYHDPFVVRPALHPNSRLLPVPLWHKVNEDGNTSQSIRVRGHLATLPTAESMTDQPGWYMTFSDLGQSGHDLAQQEANLKK